VTASCLHQAKECHPFCMAFAGTVWQQDGAIIKLPILFKSRGSWSYRPSWLALFHPFKSTMQSLVVVHL
jgi:hypothetical protein